MTENIQPLCAKHNHEVGEDRMESIIDTRNWEPIRIEELSTIDLTFQNITDDSIDKYKDDCHKYSGIILNSNQLTKIPKWFNMTSKRGDFSEGGNHPIRERYQR